MTDHTAQLTDRLALQGIRATDEDVERIQQVLDFIGKGERKLDDFPELSDAKIALVLDLEA